GCVGGCGVVAGEGENVLDAESGKVLESALSVSAGAIDASEVNVGSEAACASSGADADRIVAEHSAGITGDAARDDARNLSEFGGDFEEFGFASQTAGDEFNDIAEAF